MSEVTNYKHYPPVYKSKICRICGIESEYGEELFDSNNRIEKIAIQICSNISVKLENVQTYPNWICPGCCLQFESTNDFYELIKNGQDKLYIEFGAPPNVPKKRKLKRVHLVAAIKEDQDDGSSSESIKNNVVSGKRASKIPSKYKDTMQGSELESLFSSIGVAKKSSTDIDPEPVAHIEDQDGVTIGEMLSISDNPQYRSKTRYQCDFCKEVFAKELAFYNHLSYHTNILYECTECKAVFQAKAMYNDHVRQTNHTGLGIIETPPTNPNDSNQNQSSKTATEVKSITNFVCIKCSKTFKTNLAMQRHQKTHDETRPFQCDICLARFKRNSVLQFHKSSHKKEYPFKCSKCSGRFTLRRTLQSHIKRIHEGIKPFFCNICQKYFSQKSNFEEHKRIHTGDRPFVCLKCGAAFKTSSQCRLHQKTHVVLVQENGETVPRKKEINPKTVKCPTCDKYFTQRSAMKKHLRIHTGEKPYSCPMCPKKFSDPSNFNKHKQVHLQEKKQKQDARQVSLLKMNSNEVSSGGSTPTTVITTTDPNPDVISDETNSAPTTTSNSFSILEDITLPPVDTSLINIMNMDDSFKWNSDLTVTDIPNDEKSIYQQQKQQEMLLNQLVCISYQDPLNPVTSKTTYYVVK